MWPTLLVLLACGSDGADTATSSCEAHTWYADQDGDGYGDDTITQQSCQAPTHTSEVGGDCDDTDPRIHPQGIERCDGVDDDCDGYVDDDDLSLDPSSLLSWYPDADGDGYGDPRFETRSCAAPSGAVGRSGDCDDDNAMIHPGAPERCDGVDQDCDGVADEDAFDAPTWYSDDDNDGYGDVTETIRQCTAPSGTVADATDCDDGHSSVWPGAPEVCDERDNDCDGLTDQDDPDLDPNTLRWIYPDDDGDGYGDRTRATRACTVPSGFTQTVGDCDDADSRVTPLSVGWCGEQSVDQAGTVLLGVAMNDRAGQVVARAPDQDGDGRPELLVGAPWESTGASFAGAVYLVLSATSGESSLSEAEASFTGVSSSTEVGAALSAGDRGDGAIQLLIGAPGDRTGGTDAGAAWLFVDPGAGSCSVEEGEAVILGDPWAQLGVAVDVSADLNGDGVRDLVVGAPGLEYDGLNPGAALVFFGPVSGVLSPDHADLSYIGQVSRSETGASLAATGDLDGDGLDDLLIGAPGENSAGYQTGAAYVALGGLSGATSLDDARTKLMGELAGDEAGGSVAAPGDLDGDGLAELLVGATGAGTGAGMAYLALGSTSGASALAGAWASVEGVATGDELGAAVAGAGDVNGDGTPDLAIGAPHEGTGGYLAGSAYLFYGPLTGDLPADDAELILRGAEPYGYAGAGLAGGGDWDGDGLDDLAVGAWGAWGAEGSCGEVFVWGR